MDTVTLTEALRVMEPDTYTWTLGMYSTSRSRDGLEMEWNLCNMRGAAAYADALRLALLKKPVADKPVAPYSPLLSDKENIGALGRTDELIREHIDEILASIRGGQAYAPEDFLSGLLPKTVGYALYGERTGEDAQATDQVLFMRRGSPFLTGAARLCIGEGSDITLCEKPLLKFTMAADFVLIGGVCYFFSAAIQKDFEMENRHIALAGKRMELIAEKGIINDYDRLEACVMTAKNARKFVDFDKQILEHIVALPIQEREEFLSIYGVTIDHEGHMDTTDAEQCELVIDLLCCRSCLDPLGRLSIGNNITPRE